MKTPGIAASRLQLPPGAWATVLDCLCERFPAITRAQWLDRMARGRVRDGEDRIVGPERAHAAGLEIRYFREVADEQAIPLEETVLARDAHLLVVDKPHFLPVAPTGAYVEQTLLARLRRRFDAPELAPLHRIDRETAGLVLFSTDPATRGAYQALFRERRIDKTYHAVAAPMTQALPCVHRSRLERGEPFFRMREVAGEANSETRIDVAARGAAAWRYVLKPSTGRKHQLRVHMAALGAPILHDRLYPDLVARGTPDDYVHPLQLLAHSLAFVDPLDGRRRTFSSRLSLQPV